MLLAAIGYCLLLLLVVVFQGKMIFLPPGTYAADTPAAAGLPFEDLRLPVTPGTFIHAWWVPARDVSSTVIVYFHGNAEVLEDEVGREVPLLHRTGANLLLVDFRGYGGSTRLQTSGATAVEDARAAMRYLRRRGFDDSQVVIAGWSIGSAVAVRLAAETPKAKGLILFSPISSVTDIALEMKVFRHALRPALWFLGSNKLDSAAKIASIHVPLLIFSGSDDTLATPAMARKLFDRANAPKRLQMIAGAGHDDIMDHRDGLIETELRTFLAALGVAR